jgi:hypothetical protein
MASVDSLLPASPPDIEILEELLISPSPTRFLGPAAIAIRSCGSKPELATIPHFVIYVVENKRSIP